MEKKKVNLNTTVEKDLKDKARQAAKQDGRTLSSFINKMLSDFFNKKEETPQPKTE